MKIGENVKVSICIPTFNSESFIQEAIDSVIFQNFTDYELIIIDDCSNDNTLQILNNYKQKYPNIRLYVNDVNLGIVGNFNKCIEVSKAEYIKFLLNDDYFLNRESLRTYVELMDKYSDVTLVSSGRNFVDENSDLIKKVIKYKEGYYESGESIIKDCLLKSENKIGEPTSVIFRKKQAIRGFKHSYKQLLDLEMWFYLLEKGSFYYIEEPLVAFRVHPKQMSTINKKNLSYIDDNFLIVKDYIKKPYVGLSAALKFLFLCRAQESLYKLHKKGEVSYEFMKDNEKRHFAFSYPLFYRPFYKFAKNILRLKFLR